MSYEWSGGVARAGRRQSETAVRTAPAGADAAIVRSAGYLYSSAGPRRLLVRRADRRHHSRIGLHSAAALAAPARWRTLESSQPRAHRQSRARHSRPAAFRWRLQYLVRRPRRSQRHHQSLLRPETGRHARRFRPDAPGPRAHPGPGRSAGRQQLRQDQPQPFRTLSAQARAFGAARDHHAARQRALRDVLLDAVHPGAAFHRAGTRRQPQGARRLHAG